LATDGDPGAVNPLATAVSPAPLWLRSEGLFASAAGPISCLKRDVGQIGHQFGQADIGQKLIAPQIHHERRSPEALLQCQLPMGWHQSGFRCTPEMDHRGAYE
jgi:hypothetical protein